MGAAQRKWKRIADLIVRPLNGVGGKAEIEATLTRPPCCMAAPSITCAAPLTPALSSQPRCARSIR